MPAKPLPKRERLARRRRWREIVTWAFDDNLTMAADLLRLPYSTARVYQNEGPRRMKRDVLYRLETLTWLGGWLLGTDDQGRPNPNQPRSLDQDPGRSGTRIYMMVTEPHGRTDWDRLFDYQIPKCVWWRLERLVDAMMERMDATASGGTREGWARQAVTAPIAIAAQSGLLADEPYGLERARRVHRLAAYWEDEIGIGRPTFDTTWSFLPSPR